jgi:hypothetical protein
MWYDVLLPLGIFLLCIAGMLAIGGRKNDG